MFRLPDDPPDCRAFTLLEIMIAMLLIAMVVLIVGQSLGITVDAWERGSQQAYSIQVRQAVPAVLARQLEALTADNLFHPAMGDFRQRFCGEAGHLTFLTTWAPLASSLQGMQRVAWSYQPDSRRLYFFQQVITQPEDLADENNPLADDWQENFGPTSYFDEITAFELWFTDQDAFETDNSDHWQDAWECGDSLPDAERKPLPVAIMLHIEVGRAPQSPPPVWILPVGTR